MAKTEEKIEHVKENKDEDTHLKINRIKKNQSIQGQSSTTIPNKRDSEIVQLETVDTLIHSESITVEDYRVVEHQSSKNVTDHYLDSLLREAEQDIQLEKSLHSESKYTVDSEALLEHVENDIEHSFREKVFDAVKTGFNKVKTAVVERNK